MGSGHGAQADDAGCGFLAAADDVGEFLSHGAVEHADQITAIINDNIAVVGQNLPQVSGVLLLTGIVPGIDIEAGLGQGRGDIILCGEGVGPGHIHLCSACGKHFAQIGRLCLQVDGEGDADAGEGLFSSKIFLQTSEEGAVLFDPVNFVGSVCCQADISDFTVHIFFSLQPAVI
ncbi:hypothetical protein GCWU000342_01413 [Shuttleworthella satelles DSM 14600]|uniref:Uncharacterized protein n=1 Tax=Shuttleworthella satelles DSM 14600 TaxID=626523 RepID=C4GBV9_9FIRM|nr:hypothetical protein GCWU000342_01413 [Shuttleworthia satelles DSM 14600]